MTTLNALADARKEVLKAEIAALLHNLGKLSIEFIGSKTGESIYENFDYKGIVGIVSDLLSSRDYVPNVSHRQVIGRFGGEEQHRRHSEKDQEPYTAALLETLVDASTDLTAKQWMRQPLVNLPTPLNDRIYSIGDFIAFQDIRWYRPTQDRPSQRIQLFYPASRATALLEQAHHSASGGEKESSAGERGQQHFDPIFIASAFGCESEPIDKEDLKSKRDELVLTLYNGITIGIDLHYREIVDLAKQNLSLAVGDTQHPINDIKTWDLCYTVAALFKAAVAKALLQNRWSDPSTLFDGEWEYDTIYDRQGISNPNPARWRLLHVSFDGLDFWGQAHHVTDLLERRQALYDGLDAIRDILEVEYPLGNEVYRDEHGSVFVVPDVEGLLGLTDEDNTPLKRLLEEAFDVQGAWGELVPEIKVNGPYEGKDIKLAQVLKGRRQKNVPEPDVAAACWAKGQRPNNAEICTVCGQRPVGYPAESSPHEKNLDLQPWAEQDKAENRNICRVCLQRRGRRARDWARNIKTEEEKLGPFERTIWTDEVADDNGRFALVVGRFVLDGWLDGKLIPTMLKSASVARIHRCWDTTQRFWQDVQNEVILGQIDQRLRLGLRSVNVGAINQEGRNRGLGSWHTFEAEVGGRRLGLCWDPNDEDTKDRNLFWTTTNLCYLGRQLGFTEETLKDPDKLVEQWRDRLEIDVLHLYEPGGYLGQERRANVDAEGCRIVRQEHFYPFVPLTVEPALFMALVPADKALGVIEAIRDKYDAEMARVRDRLPVHLGLIFAPRRTPLAAVLGAGRAMLRMPAKWEEWQIETQGRVASFSQNGQAFDWEYPDTMGDDTTEDIWYPHLLVVDPTTKTKELNLEAGDFRLVEESTGSVWIRPSRFDFEFLDTTARRFEIHYDENGRRPRRTRPFLLDDLERLEELWKELCRLEKTQRHQVIATIEATREAWFRRGREEESLKDGVFEQFVRDTLACAAWPDDRKWKDICQDNLDKRLVSAGMAGELADLAELHMQILKE